jgi:hypothetical protein
MKTQRKMNNLTSTELYDTKNIVIGPERQEKYIHLPFNKKDKYFTNPSDLIKFIQDVEKVIRTSKEYSNYIKYLKNDVGLHNCSLFRDIDDSKAPIEMHHGPIFTLYDIVEIQVAYLYKHKMPINSYRLAHNILKDHWNNIIQVVMLCKTAHTAVHNLNGLKDKKRYFLSADAAWGDINKFIEKYHEAFSITHYNKLKDYVKNYNLYKRDSSDIKPELFTNKITEWVHEFKNKNRDAA